MNSAQLHLAFTHVPVILSLTGSVMLIVALLMKNNTLVKTSYVVLVVAAIAAIPVFFSGEEAEEAVEHLPGVSESIISKHESLATASMIAISVAGGLSLIALLLYKQPMILKAAKLLVLAVALISGGLMTQTAHLGGQIRHSEIRTGAASQNPNEAGNEKGGQENDNEKDDD